MAITGDNEYDVRVYRYSEDDGVPALQRALHAELCRQGELGLHTSGMPACARAFSVVQRAQAEGVLRLALTAPRLTP